MKESEGSDFLSTIEWLSWKQCRSDDGRAIKSQPAAIQRGIGKAIADARNTLGKVQDRIGTDHLQLLEVHARQLMTKMDARLGIPMPAMEDLRPTFEMTRSIIFRNWDRLASQR